MKGTGYCELCKTNVPTLELLLHITVHHAAFAETLETWPDGEVVVIDSTLQPSDFLDPSILPDVRAARPELPLTADDFGLLMELIPRTRWDRVRAWFKARLGLS